MCNKKSKLLQIHLSDVTNKQNEIIYKRYRNRTNRFINKAKNNFTKKEIYDNFKNPKKMWEIVNRLTGRIIKAVDDILLKSFRIKAKNLADKFSQDFEKNVSDIVISCNEPLLDENSYINTAKVSLRINKINDIIVEKLIKKINDKKSLGYDKIRAKDIKYISFKITPVIKHLINQCISTSTYPDQLKIGLVRPIHKKGCFTNTNHYRPITILSCVDKIIEKYFGQKINEFLSNNGIIHEKQFGFQRKKSTTQLLSLFTEEVNNHLNNKRHVLAIMIDFSKAFDTLNHETLYKKMQQNGIQGPTLDWFKNYHTNRYNTVSIAGEHSDLKQSLRGTAQGSVIGPTEYLIYVNDMCKLFQRASVYQFADDTCLIVGCHDLEVAQCTMQKEFDLLCKWAHDVGLSINYEKTKLMHIHSSYLKSSITPTIVAHEHNCMHLQQTPCDCKPLEIVKQHTYLGLVIDDKFNWGPHVDHVCNRLRAILAKIKILKQKIPYNTLRLLYLSMADSIINYGITSYGYTYKTYLKRIYNIQTRLLKTIVPLKIKYEHRNNYENLFQYCKVMSVYDKVKLAIVCDNQNKIQSLNLKKRYGSLRTLPKTPTFNIPNCNNEYGRRIWTYSLPHILNSLPKTLINNVRDANPKQVRSLLKRYYIYDRYKKEGDVRADNSHPE
ncbi:uncharacterized protein LOC119692001 [Plutella xylostella]|nr:uncharacterized protein LOC119692001 [Plutella xylostella]